MLTKIKLQFVFGYQAILYAFGLLALCGAIPWGRWYSTFPAHRLQADAFLRGDLALSHDPFYLSHDRCWSQGGVHQVWGLGVPLWEFLFEAPAKLLGMAPFPDRIALGLFIALGAYVVLRTWLGPSLKREWESTTALGPKPNRYQASGAVLLILFFPPLVSVLRYRMWVYEEVMVYVYFFEVLLMCGLVALATNPTFRRFWALCALAGLGITLRPTVLFYGFATVVAGCFIMARHRRLKPDKSMPPSQFIWKLFPGVLFFLAGGGFVFITNYLRFGSGWEFGHRLNLQGRSLAASVYSTRFDFPFSRVPLTQAARELFGSLFQVNYLNGENWYASGILAGQSSTARFREFSFSTFDAFYAIGIGAACLIAARVLWQWSRCRLSNRQSGGSPHLLQPNIVIIAWSILAVLPLAVLYMKTPVIASRYMLDFAAAFAAALLGLWCWIHQQLPLRYCKRISVCLLVLLVGWIGSEIIGADGVFWSPRGISRRDVLEQKEYSQRDDALSKSLPNEYKIGDSLEAWNLPYNGTGWNPTDGSTRLCATFFVQSPQFLELELAAIPGSHLTEDSLTTIQAKIGLEFLKRDSITLTNGSWILRFAGPNDPKYQKDLQPVFVAMVPSEKFAQYLTRPSPWILKRLRWQTK